MAKRRAKPPRAVSKSIVPARRAPLGPLPDPSATLHLRTLFWHNVVRDMLTTLSVMQQMQEPDAAKQGVSFDGAIAVLTNAGERIPIAEVVPMFACGIPGSASEQALSVAVECTVFRIRTPGGEVFTLPLHEIRGLHAMSPELLQQLEKETITGASPGGEPFGFAAFTSMSKERGNGGAAI